MSKPRSPKIEDVAYDFLKAHYRATYTATNINVRHKVSSKSGAEVDGLLLFNTVDNAPFCAAVVTTNSSSLSKLLTTYKTKGLSKYRYLTTALVFIAAAYLLFGALHWAVVAAIATVAALATFIIHSVFEKKNLQSKVSKMVEHMQNFPANEQWIGITISSLTFRNNSLARHLLSLCREKGIGIITIGQRAKVVLMQEPKAVPNQGPNFVKNYDLEAGSQASPDSDKKRPGSNLRVA